MFGKKRYYRYASPDNAIEGIKRAVKGMKQIESAFQKDRPDLLSYVTDVIDRTALAIRDELIKN